MTVFVLTASRYGATTEIGDAIAEEFRAQGFETVAQPVEAVLNIGSAEAVVLGSAVYIGRWLREAREFASTHQEALRERPVWIFSSGPIGIPPKPAEDPVDVAEILEVTGAREHHVFAGRLDRDRLRFVDRAVVTALRAPEGDYRDWDAIREWGRELATTIQPVSRPQ